MKNTVFFAVCRYVPSLLRGEKLNIGFAYHVPSDGHMEFFASKNIRRIRTFDDEIDTEMINVIFESLCYDFSSDNFDNFDEYDNEDLINPRLLSNKITNYVNQVQFSDVSVYESNDNLEKTLNDIADMYLYYDKQKNERMNHERVRSLATKIVNASSYKDSLIKSINDDAFYDRPYDFKINLDGQRKYIKGFSFDYKQTNRFFKEVKSYLFDLEHELSKGLINLSDIKIIINNTDLDSSHEKLIQDYLPSGLKLMTLEKFSEFIKETDKGFLN